MGNIYLQPRYYKLLQILLLAEGWVDGNKIAGKLGVSTRTVRSDINAVNYLLNGHGVSIQSSRQNGYILNYKDRGDLEKMIYGEKAYDSPEGRMRHISIKLLQADTQSPLDIDDFADDLLVSSNTLESDLKKIKETLEQRTNPVNIQRKNNRIWVVADEAVRRFLLREMILDRADENFIYVDNYYKHFGVEASDAAMRCIKDAAFEQALSLTDGDMIHLMVYLSIKILRVKAGCLLEGPHDDLPKSVTCEIRMASAITENVCKAFGIKLTESEHVDIIKQLSLFMLDFGDDGNALISVNERSDYYIQIVDSLLADIKDKYLLDLRTDPELRRNLIRHVARTVESASNFTKTTNPILMLLKNDYPFAFEMSLYLYERINAVFGVSLSEDELGFISSYLSAAIERLEANLIKGRPIIAVVSNNDAATARLLIARLISIFGDHYDIQGPFPFHCKERAFDMKPALVISTGPIAKLAAEHIPAVHIAPALNIKDIAVIDKCLAALKKSALRLRLPYEKRRCFREEFFYLHPQAETQEEIIRFMADTLYKKGIVPVTFCEKTLDRERIHPTIFGRNMAMPHPIEAVAHETVIAVAILANPVKWSDQGMVKLIFMLAVKKADVKYLSDFFDMTVTLVDQPAKVVRLGAVRSFQEFTAELFCHNAGRADCDPGKDRPCDDSGNKVTKDVPETCGAVVGFYYQGGH